MASDQAAIPQATPAPKPATPRDASPRVGDPRLKPRVREAAALVVPWLPSSEVDALPAPIAMRQGDSWTSNLNLGPLATPTNARDRLRALSAAEAWQLQVIEERQRVHQFPKKLPPH